jgi:hypothetical protein
LIDELTRVLRRISHTPAERLDLIADSCRASFSLVSIVLCLIRIG